jgi:hypothetical protein
MWNSNSLISWLIAKSGLDFEAIAPPCGGRAPGWHAGIVVAQRTRSATDRRPLTKVGLDQMEVVQ